jgi:predicted extracellular nuclease
LPELTLKDLHDRFNLSRAQDFFTEWTINTNPLDLTPTEMQSLDRVQQNYLSQLEAQLMNAQVVQNYYPLQRIYGLIKV